MDEVFENATKRYISGCVAELKRCTRNTCFRNELNKRPKSAIFNLFSCGRPTTKQKNDLLGTHCVCIFKFRLYNYSQIMLINTFITIISIYYSCNNYCNHKLHLKFCYSFYKNNTQVNLVAKVMIQLSLI